MLHHLLVTPQQLSFERFTTSNGLPSDEVYNLYQDHQGYIWIFTNSGVVKHDGATFKPVLTNLPVDERFVYSHYQQPGGRMWIATSRARIYEVVGDSAVKIQGIEALSREIAGSVNEIFELYVDEQLNIYVVTKHHCFRLAPGEGGTYNAMRLTKGPADSITFRVYDKGKVMLPVHNFSGNDSTFCGGIDALRLIFHVDGDSLYQKVQCRFVSIRHFKRFSDDIYFNHYDHLVKVNRSGQKSMPGGALINNFTKDHRGHTWIATYLNGLLELDANDSLINHYFRHRIVNDVLLDHQGGLWVSTTGLGLFYARDLTVKNFPLSHDLSKTITSLVSLPEGVLAGNSDGEVYLIDATGSHTRLYRHAAGAMRHAAQWGDTTLVAFMPGVKRVKLPEGRWQNIEVPSTKSAPQKIALHDDNIYYLHTRRIHKMVGSEMALLRIFRERIYDLEFVGADAFVSSDKGLYRFSSNFNNVDTVLSGIKVKEITFTPDSLLMVCAPGHGVLVVEGSDIIHFSGQDDLPSDYVNKVIYQDNKVILATQHGVFARKAAPGRKYLGTGDWSRVYDGNVDQVAIQDNHLYVATARGLLVISSDHLFRKSSTKFSLDLMRASGRQKTGDSLVLEADENNLEFSYNFISLDQARRDVVYKLRGPFSDSGLALASPIKFSHLPPGNYTFSMFPNTHDGRQMLVSRTFRVRPAFWQTTGFAVTILLLGITAVFSGSVITNRYMRRKREKRVEAENKLIEYKLVALKAQINPHFMSNCLAAIQHLIATKKVDEANQYIARFGQLVRQTLNYSDMPLLTVAQELSLAKQYVALEQLRFEHEIGFVVKTAADIDPDHTYLPSLILNPIIENAIWHGLLPMRELRDRRIIVEISRAADLLEVSVTDNGAGLPVSAGGEHSRGLRIIRERLENLNLLYGVYFKFQIEAIKAGDKVTGTSARLIIPGRLKPVNP